MSEKRSRTYAQDTNVPAYKSQAEVRQMLAKMGADQFALMEMDGRVVMRFRVRQTTYQIERPALPDIPKKSVEQRERAAWRALVLLVKAKMVAIDQGITTVEREFFADVVLRDGSKLIEHQESLIDWAYEDGPPRLGFEP